MRKISEGILGNLVEKWDVSSTSGMDYCMILVKSLFFDQNLFGNLSVDIFM